MFEFNDKVFGSGIVDSTLLLSLILELLTFVSEVMGVVAPVTNGSFTDDEDDVDPAAAIDTEFAFDADTGAAAATAAADKDRFRGRILYGT
jgi:hypothetical protein